MKGKKLLSAGKNVTITLNTGEEISGKIILRSGFGDENNYIFSKERILLKHENGNSVEAPFSSIKSVR